jgi:uncharacterized protein YegP (UPF0339 family)
MPSTRFELVRDARGYHARFVSNGNIIWWTESYTTKQNAHAAVNLISRLAEDAPLYDLTNYAGGASRGMTSTGGFSPANFKTQSQLQK